MPQSSDEAAFQRWYADQAKQYGLNSSPDGQFYDYRAAFRAGAKPDASGHWPSTFKQAGHPNEIVGGFNTRTGERAPGTPRASEPELVRMGWAPSDAKRLAAMPEQQQSYTIRDPQTGKTVTLRGDSPPTEAELTDIFAKLNAQAPAEKPAVPKSWLNAALDWLPTAGGAIGGVIGGIPGAAMGGAAGQGLKVTAQHAAELPGAVVDVARNVVAHPRETLSGAWEGAKQGATDAAVAGGVQGLSQGAGQGVVAAAKWAAPKLMTSALKPVFDLTKSAVTKSEMPRVIQTMLDDGINVTHGGIQKLTTLLQAGNDQLDDIIAGAAREIDPVRVVKVAQSAVRGAANQAAPSTDKAAARKVIKDFIDSHVRGPNGTIRPMTAARAQELKKGTYRAMGNRAYGETQGAALETEKQLARGLKEGVEIAYPEARGINAALGARGEAQKAVVKRVAGAENRDPGGIGLLNPNTLIAFVLMRSPAAKSMLARGLYQSASRASGVPENMIRTAVQALASSSEDEQ